MQQEEIRAMKTAKHLRNTDEIGFIGTQPRKALNAAEEKKKALKTRKAMDDYRSRELSNKKAA